MASLENDFELKNPFGIQHRRLSKLLQSFTVLKGRAVGFIEDCSLHEFEIDLVGESCLTYLLPETTAGELSSVLKTSDQTGNELKFLSLTDELPNSNRAKFSNA